MSLLAEKRKTKGYTQAEIAGILGVATSTYNQYEKGERRIPVEYVNILKNLLDISDDDNIFLPSIFTVSKIS